MARGQVKISLRVYPIIQIKGGSLVVEVDMILFLWGSGETSLVAIVFLD